MTIIQLFLSGGSTNIQPMLRTQAKGLYAGTRTPKAHGFSRQQCKQRALTLPSRIVHCSLGEYMNQAAVVRSAFSSDIRLSPRPLASYRGSDHFCTPTLPSAREIPNPKYLDCCQSEGLRPSHSSRTCHGACSAQCNRIAISIPTVASTLSQFALSRRGRRGRRHTVRERERETQNTSQS